MGRVVPDTVQQPLDVRHDGGHGPDHVHRGVGLVADDIVHRGVGGGVGDGDQVHARAARPHARVHDGVQRPCGHLRREGRGHGHDPGAVWGAGDLPDHGRQRVVGVDHHVQGVGAGGADHLEIDDSGPIGGAGRRGAAGLDYNRKLALVLGADNLVNHGAYPSTSSPRSVKVAAVGATAPAW